MPIRTNRIRYGAAPPAPGALQKGELAVQLGGGEPTLWVGTGGNGLVKFAQGIATQAGDIVSQERGGLVYADEQQTSGTTLLLLRTPVRFTLERLTAKTGSGTCDIVIVANGVTYDANQLSATSTISATEFNPETSVAIPPGASIAMTVSNAVDLTSLVVQLDWLEG